MIRLTEIAFENARPVDGYGPDFFRIGGAVLTGPVLVTAQAARSWGGLDDIAPLLALAGQVDVLLLGTGAIMGRAPATMVAALDPAGIGVEAMDSATAARTYNVLLSEGRRVAAALLTVG
jgi:uncharacterized protein